MYQIINKTIYVNRGDAMTIHIVNRTDIFHAGDYLILSICEEGNLENTLFMKRVDITEDSGLADISLSSTDTRSFCDAFKSGSKTFWYELELNENTTLIGYDKTGPKLFIVYPEASKIGGSI